MLFVGDDWAEEHHDIEVQDETGKVLAKKLASPGLKTKAQHLLEVLAQDPFTTPPKYEKLVGALVGCYSRRINIQHRLVYEVLPERHVVHILRMWTHCE